MISFNQEMIILDSSVGREKDMQDIDVHAGVELMRMLKKGQWRLRRLEKKIK